MYTAGVVGGLTLTAACAPSEKYLMMGGPLSLGLGVVCMASIGKERYYYTVGLGVVFTESHPL